MIYLGHYILVYCNKKSDILDRIYVHMYTHIQKEFSL